MRRFYSYDGKAIRYEHLTAGYIEENCRLNAKLPFIPLHHREKVAPFLIRLCFSLSLFPVLYALPQALLADLADNVYAQTSREVISCFRSNAVILLNISCGSSKSRILSDWRSNDEVLGISALKVIFYT
jgi:hypothetical protein